MAIPFYTIGHSTRSLDEFVALLRASEIELLVDVRAIPRSRRNPQFNKDSLPDSLRAVAIGYEHAVALGGRRGRTSKDETSPNGFWTHASFRNYADYAMGPDFRAALARLRELGHRHRSAIMCAEAVWWRCHRRIIADYLVSAGECVLHILGPDKIEPAALTAEAQRQEDGTLVYPPPRTEQYALGLTP
jgi:uncharacterized protein (DUF488 family)